MVSAKFKALPTRAEETEPFDKLIHELRDAIHARDVFLGIAAHELKTPLTTLVLQVASLQRAGTRGTLERMPIEKLQGKVETIARQVARLQALVMSVLDVARITSGRLQLTRERVDLEQAVRDVVGQLEEALGRCQSKLELKLSPIVGVWDRFRIETVIANLLSNAVKFGEGRPICVSVTHENRVARITVKDHGIGISKDQQAKIFDKFERAVPEQHYGGLGLGLWIVRQIVEAHDGSISVDSETGKGSTFVVDLPTGMA